MQKGRCYQAAFLHLRRASRAYLKQWAHVVATEGRRCRRFSYGRCNSGRAFFPDCVAPRSEVGAGAISRFARRAHQIRHSLSLNLDNQYLFGCIIDQLKPRRGVSSSGHPRFFIVCKQEVIWNTGYCTPGISLHSSAPWSSSPSSSSLAKAVPSSPRLSRRREPITSRRSLLTSTTAMSAIFPLFLQSQRSKSSYKSRATSSRPSPARAPSAPTSSWRRCLRPRTTSPASPAPIRAPADSAVPASRRIPMGMSASAITFRPSTPLSPSTTRPARCSPPLRRIRSGRRRAWAVGHVMEIRRATRS